MSVVILSTGYFPDPDIGAPISEGYIYVGEPDTDPEIAGNQKQISVLQEDTTTIPVAQPLRTSAGGVPTHNGSPVTILVDGQYSIKVLDKTLVQKYYIPSVAGVEFLDEDDMSSNSATQGATQQSIVAYVRKFDTVALLRASSGPFASNQSATLTEYYASSGAGGGTLYWDSDSTESDNGGTIFKVTSIAIGRWKRFYSGGVNLDWFGAKGDGVTDDTVSIQAALDSTHNVSLTRLKVYIATDTLSMTTDNQIIDGNNARIVATYEQSGSPDYTESLFYIYQTDNVLIKNIRLQYTGTFDFGDYGGFISGIQVEESDYFTADNVEAFGFNRAGINIATLASTAVYCKEPRIINCRLHTNRVAGCLFGNTDEGQITGSTLSFNGIVTSIGTGYGFAAWSAKYARNTVIDGNRAIDNHRKGIDFHAGENGIISNNISARNRVYGIYVMAVNGSWVITGNTITEMEWDNAFPTVSPYGIRVGDLVGQGLSAAPTTFVVDGNVISDFTKTAGDMYPLGDSGVGLSYGKITFSNNIIDVGDVSVLHNGANGVTGTAGNYYDISFIGNQFRADSCDSALSPISIRSSKNRQKVFDDNIIEIIAITANDGVVSYDNTAIASNSFIADDNIITVPASGWSGVFDPINVKRVTAEKMVSNIVNGVVWRDWDGHKFVDRGTAAPAANFWTQGSRLEKTDVAAGGTPGYVCTTAGTPGTWKAMAVVAA